jgi:hypothetical protein
VVSQPARIGWIGARAVSCDTTAVYHQGAAVYPSRGALIGNPTAVSAAGVAVYPDPPACSRDAGRCIHDAACITRDSLRVSSDTGAVYRDTWPVMPFTRDVHLRPRVVHELGLGVNSVTAGHSRETADVSSIYRGRCTRERQQFIVIPPVVQR